jgi:hypothetical protein
MFLILLLLLRTSFEASYSFTDTLVMVTTVSSGSITTFGVPGDACKKIKVGATGVYHVSQSAVYQSWRKGSLGVQTSLQNVTSGVEVLDFAVSSSESNVILVANQMADGRVMYLLDGAGAITTATNYTAAVIQSQITITTSSLFYLTKNSTNVTIYKTNYTGFVQSGFFLAVDYVNMIDTPDRQKLLFWSALSSVKIYNAAVTPPALLSTYTPSTVPASNSTKKITFSQDSTLAIIETDSYNPVVVLRLADCQVIHTISINDVIDSAHFVDGSNTLMMVFGQSATVVVDLITGSQYAIPVIPGVDRTSDWSSIFTCYNNVVQQLTISLSKISPSDKSSNYYLPLEVNGR